MEKIREEEVTMTKTIHEFYCDRCNEYLGSYSEYHTGDGVFQTEIISYCNFDASVELPGHSMGIYKCLCRKCQGEEEAELAEKLRAIGFTEPTL